MVNKLLSSKKANPTIYLTNVAPIKQNVLGLPLSLMFSCQTKQILLDILDKASDNLRIPLFVKPTWENVSK